MTLHVRFGPAISESDLYNQFGSFGSVENIVVPQCRDTGEVRGFGFVTMHDPREALAAMDSLNSSRLMRVSVAQRRKA